MRVLRFLALTALTMSMGASLPAMAADFVYATQDLTARRWQDAETPTSGDVKVNDRLEVIYKGQGWIRVRLAKAPKFGWVPETAVTATAPEGAEAPTGGTGMEGMTPELQKMIQDKMRELGQQPPTGGAPEGDE